MSHKAPPHAFKKGQSGNPKGKPPGTRSKSTQLLIALMEGNAEEITKTVIAAAKAGDLTAARIVLERLVPQAKERPVIIDLPETQTAEGVNAAQSSILQAVANGDLLPGEAATLSGIVESKRRSIETQDLSDRIAALETKNENA